MLDVKQAALHCCVSESMIRGWLKEGLPHYRLGARGRRGKIAILVEDLDGWMANFRVTPKKPEPVKAPAPRQPFKHLKL